MGKFVIKTVKDQFHFVLKAGNGEIILQSEHYKSKASAINGIESIKKNVDRDGAFEVKELTSKSGETKWHFVLKAGNHEIIGQSEQYNTLSACENGIASVTKNAPEAEVVDETA